MPELKDYVQGKLDPLKLPVERKTEIVEEISAHMEAAYEEASGRGMSELEAKAFAESSFVPWEDLRRSLERAERTTVAEPQPSERERRANRDRSGKGIRTMLVNLWQDLRFGLRTFRKRPLFAAVAIGTLGLGIGTTTTMFSIVDGVLLRQLPFNRPGQLVTLWKTWPGFEGTGKLSWSEFVEFRDNAQAFQDVAVFRPERLILTGSGEPASLLAGVATASLFPTLGVRPHLGRFFQTGEDGNGALGVAVLSFDIWRSRFGSDSSVIGRAITLDEVPYEVLGVLPAGFRLRNRPGGSEIETGVDTGERDVWLPVGFDGDDLQNWNMSLEFIGRVRAEVTFDQARAEAIALLSQEMQRTEMEVHFASVKEDETSSLRLPLLLLLGAAGILSLIACANVANLLVSEAIGRSVEIRTRVALGASRFVIARLLLIESVILGLGGGILGLALAVLGVRAAVTVGPYLPGLEGVHVDVRILLFAMTMGVLTGVLFGLTPALMCSRLSSNISAAGGSRRGGQQFQRRVLTIVFALTTVLLVTGALLTRSFANLIRLDTGFVASNVATARLPVLPTRYEELEPRDAFLSRVVAEIEAIPGVIQASGADNLPYPGAPSGHKIRRADGADSLHTPLRRVLADYHDVMGIPLLEGRAFTETDVEGNTPVAILSQSAARQLWPGESAVGASVNHRSYGDLTIVGVVGDVMEGWVGREARPMTYLPLAQTAQEEVSLIARTEGDPVPIIPFLRRAVWSVDPDVAVAMETTIETLVAESSLSERYRTLLVMFFGLSATLLAAVGIFGVTARSVALRKRELGIRVALGATADGLVRMILRGSLTTALVGTTVGLIGAWCASRLLAGYLFGVEPSDPITYVTVVSILVGVCLMAGYLPTRRVALVDPVEVLKAE